MMVVDGGRKARYRRLGWWRQRRRVVVRKEMKIRS
jgi:hypothetical protein